MTNAEYALLFSTLADEEYEECNRCKEFDDDAHVNFAWKHGGAGTAYSYAAHLLTNEYEAENVLDNYSERARAVAREMVVKFRNAIVDCDLSDDFEELIKLGIIEIKECAE